MKYLIILICFCIICCKPTDFAGKLAAGANYTRYVSSLEKSGMANTAMGKEWLSIGRQILTDTNSIALPYYDEGYFTSNRIDAKSYQFNLEKGTILEVSVKSQRGLELFMDVFYVKERNERIRYDVLSPIDPNRRKLQFKTKDDGTYVIRLQSALLLGGKYEIEIEEAN
ncbi:MAG: hypothetical protein AAF806_13140 [Bacteroidota bacterium]